MFDVFCSLFLLYIKCTMTSQPRCYRTVSPRQPPQCLPVGYGSHLTLVRVLLNKWVGVRELVPLSTLNKTSEKVT